MAKVRDYHKLALDIIDVVGGQKNIVNATRCATRLRLVLKETPEGVKEKVSALAGVITVVENNGHISTLPKPALLYSAESASFKKGFLGNSIP